MTENELSKIIVDISYKIHTKLGPGLLESVYEVVLYYELTKKRITSRTTKTNSCNLGGCLFGYSISI